MSLANIYRPKNLNDIIGQEKATNYIGNALLKDRVRQAYLISGNSGIGKTTLARIFSMSLQCETRQPIPCCECKICNAIYTGKGEFVGNTKEINCISAEAIKGIVDDSRYVVMALGTPYQIYILDECQKLTKAGWDIFLKELEEPQSRIKYFLCTTEPEKIPENIQTRCLKLELQAPKAKDIISLLSKVSEAEHIKLPESVLGKISHIAHSYREALQLLDMEMVNSESEPNLI